MWLIALSITVLFAILLAIRTANKRRQEVLVLEGASGEMKAALAEVFRAIVPHIYNRLKLYSKVHKDWPWKRLRIELVVVLSAAEDFKEVELMLNEFLSDYLAKPGNQRLLVSLIFLRFPSTGENHD